MCTPTDVRRMMTMPPDESLQPRLSPLIRDPLNVMLSVLLPYAVNVEGSPALEVRGR